MSAPRCTGVYPRTHHPIHAKHCGYRYGRPAWQCPLHWCRQLLLR